MRVLEIEQLFQSEETLAKVLEECQEDFDKIDYYSGLMKASITNNPEEAKKALNELTGTYMSMKSVLAIAETEKKNREIRYYDSLRINMENEGKKFVSTTAEKQASAQVADYRRIRNIILGYTNSCEKAISTLQSLLKFLSSEMSFNNNDAQ